MRAWGNTVSGIVYRLCDASIATGPPRLIRDMDRIPFPDYTDYFEVLPSNKLAVGLWLESDRMRSLDITAENLANQKEAVKQERRLSFDNRPYATAIVDHWPQIAFQNWHNSHSLIGSFEDLNAASVDDVAKFFKTHYAPNNGKLQPSRAIQQFRPPQSWSSCGKTKES